MFQIHFHTDSKPCNQWWWCRPKHTYLVWCGWSGGHDDHLLTRLLGADARCWGLVDHHCSRPQATYPTHVPCNVI